MLHERGARMQEKELLMVHGWVQKKYISRVISIKSSWTMNYILCPFNFSGYKFFYTCFKVDILDSII